MTVTNTPVLPQIPKSSGIVFGAGSNTTSMDPSVVNPSVLLTGGLDGSLVTDIVVTSEGTVINEKIVLWKQPSSSSDWFVVLTKVLEAYTLANTDKQGNVTLVDKNVQTQAIRLGFGDILGVTHHIDQESMVVSEYTDY